MALVKYSSINIIYNPKSTGSSEAAAKRLARKIKRLYKDASVSLHATEFAGHAEQLAYECAKAGKRPLVISASGDGGYNEVVNGVMRAQAEGAKPICAVLPAGNANDHSRTLHSKPLFRLIQAGKVRRIDLLKATFVSNGQKQTCYAHSYIGLGLTPAVATELNKTELNPVKELWLAAKTFFSFQSLNIRIGRRTIAVDSVLFTNIGEMAKRLAVAKNAAPDDGKFEVVIFPHASKRALLWQIFRASVSRLEEASQAEHFTLVVRNRTKLQLDGELRIVDANTKLTIQNEQKVLSTFM